MNSAVIDPIKKTTRNRRVTSCSECSRRKQKCDRKWPCAHCLARKSPQLCQFVVAKSNAKQSASIAKVGELPYPKEQNEVADHPDEDLNIDMSYSVLGALLTEKHTFVESSEPRIHDPRRTKQELLKHFPKRSTADLLVQHFFSNVNWLFEEVHAASFLENYNIWWSQTKYQTDVDVQFAVLILRICVNAIQFLPHSATPTELEGKAFIEVERACNEAANRFDAYRPRKPSLLRVRQLLLNTATLLNDGNSKESYHVLGEAVKEARAVNLFLEAQWTDLSDYEKEERRKLFWYLYVWDRFHCTCLGRWPLIPEHYHSVRFPSEASYSISPVENAPTQFTDVILQFKLYHYMASFISAPGKEFERTDPYIVASHTQEFRSQFVETLPPCFQLENPDCSYDAIVPNLAKKRLFLHIVIYGVLEGMHKCFVGPLSPFSIKLYISQLAENEDRARLILQHRHTLADSCVNALTATTALHHLLGGGSHRYFVLSIAAIEAAAILGMMMTSDCLMIAAHHNYALLEHELLLTSHRAFQDAIKLLQLLVPRSVLAQKGLRVLEGLNRRIAELKHQEDAKKVRRTLGFSHDSTDNESSMGGSHQNHNQVQIPTVGIAPTVYHELADVGNNIEPDIGCAPESGDATLPAFMELEWEAMCGGNDISWLLDDWSSLEDSLLPSHVGAEFAW